MTAADVSGARALTQITSTPVSLEEELQRPYAHVWLGFARDVPVAYTLTWLVSDELQIIDLATTATSRRLGAASQLLSFVLSDARDRQCTRAELEVRANNSAALSLYKKFGFFTRRRRAKYYSDGEDALEMGADLR